MVRNIAPGGVDRVLETMGRTGLQLSGVWVGNYVIFLLKWGMPCENGDKQ